MPAPDFFVSYAHADKAWAEWIAWQLEAAGYAVVIQAWDFAPGSNFVLELHKVTAEAARTIAVLSPDYLRSSFTSAEWSAAFAADPNGEKRKLLPIRVREVDPTGLLGQVGWTDLVDADEATARERLLAAVAGVRAKPSLEPRFPGGAFGGAKPAFPARGPHIETSPGISRTRSVAAAIGVLLALLIAGGAWWGWRVSESQKSTPQQQIDARVPSELGSTPGPARTEPAQPGPAPKRRPASDPVPPGPIEAAASSFNRSDALDLAAKGECTAAMPLLQDMAEDEPDNGAVLAALGRCQASVKEYARARVSLERARPRLPKLTHVIDTELAAIAIALGETVDASKKIDSVLKQQPAYRPALVVNAQLLMKRGQYQQAIDILDDVFQESARDDSPAGRTTRASSCELLAEAYERNGAAEPAGLQRTVCSSLAKEQ